MTGSLLYKKDTSNFKSLNELLSLLFCNLGRKSSDIIWYVCHYIKRAPVLVTVLHFFK